MILLHVIASLRPLRWAAWLVITSLLLCPTAQAGRLMDPGLQSGLQAGQAQRVIIEYDETSAPAKESDTQRRTRRSQLKSQVINALSSTHFKTHRDFSELPMSSMILLKPESLSQLMADSKVRAIYADKVHRINLAESLPLIGQTPVANVMGRRGAGVGMAILDTGVDYTRSELGSCTAPGVPASTCKVSAMYEAATNDNALDSNGHGTEVAMTASAVAPDAKIIGVDVFNGSSAYTSDIINGINWVISNRSTYNIGVINLSLGDGIEHTSACTNSNGDAFYTPIRNARVNYGISVVVAAGNEGYSNGIASPACVSAAVAVGAVYDANVGTLGWNLAKYDSSTGTTSTVTCWDNTTTADQVTCFTDSSSMLDVWAPGAMMTVGGQNVAGTSVAAPFVTGAIAVLRSQFSSESATQIEARITSTGKAITDGRNNITKPRLDLLAAQGAPSNDNFASASSLTGSSGSVSVWNYNATAETGEPAHAGQAAMHSVWWTWTAPASGTLTLNTDGSAIDTVLAVYSGSTVSSLTALASGQGSLRMAVVAGQTYKIAIDGQSGATGALTLNWSRADMAYAVDMSVALSAPSVANVGDTVSVTATVHNAGPQSANTVQLAIGLPSGLSMSSVPSNCSLSGSTLSCSVGALAASADAAVSLTLKAAAIGTQSLSASVSSEVPESNSADNTVSVNIDVQQAVTVTTSQSDGDVPLPAWALGGLGAALWRLQRRLRQPVR